MLPECNVVERKKGEGGKIHISFEYELPPTKRSKMADADTLPLPLSQTQMMSPVIASNHMINVR